MDLLDAAYHELSVERRELKKNIKEMKSNVSISDEFDYIGNKVYNLAMELKKINDMIQ